MSTPSKPIAGRLASQITDLLDDMVAEISATDRNSPDDYLEMLSTSPILGAAVETVMLLGLGYWGQYTNTNPEYQAFIRQNFEQQQGSLTLSVSELMSVKPLGFATSEWSVMPRRDGWMLQDIQIIHPRAYTFVGTRGEGVTGIKYAGAEEEIEIGYERLVHVTNQRHLSFRQPNGVADCKRAIAAWKAWKIIVNEMLVAGQRKAVPIIVGYTEPVQVALYSADGRTPLINEADGKPVTVPASKAMLDQLENLDNRALISTSNKNKVEALAQETDGAFFMEALRLLQQMQLLAFLVPESVLVASGVGDSNLNKGHRTTLATAIRMTVEQIAEEILEKVVRNLLRWQFGNQATEDLGSFPVPETESVDQVALLNALTNAVESPNGTGFLPADLETINRGRDLAGITPAAELPARMATTPASNGNGNGKAATLVGAGR